MGLLELPRRLPSFQAAAPTSPTAGTRRTRGGVSCWAYLTHLESLSEQHPPMEKHKKGVGVGKVLGVPGGRGSPETAEDGVGWQEVSFLGRLLPKVQDKESFLASQVSDCTSRLFVWGRESPPGPGWGHRHTAGLEFGVTPREWRACESGVCGGTDLDCRIPPAWGFGEKIHGVWEIYAPGRSAYLNVNFPLCEMGAIRVSAAQGCGGQQRRAWAIDSQSRGELGVNCPTQNRDSECQACRNAPSTFLRQKLNSGSERGGHLPRAAQ